LSPADAAFGSLFGVVAGGDWLSRVECCAGARVRARVRVRDRGRMRACACVRGAARDREGARRGAGRPADRGRTDAGGRL